MCLEQWWHYLEADEAKASKAQSIPVVGEEQQPIPVLGVECYCNMGLPSVSW